VHGDHVHVAAGNRRVTEILEGLYRSIERVRHMHLRDGSEVERLRAGYQEHEVYVTPILGRQPAQAEHEARVGETDAR